MEGLRDGVLAVLFDPGDDEVRLLLGQELETAPSLRSMLGEVDDGHEANERDGAGENALHDEDPAPAGDAGELADGCIWLGLGWAVSLAQVVAGAVGVEVHEAVREDARESGRHAADEEEDGVALLELVPGIPAREEVSAACTVSKGL